MEERVAYLDCIGGISGDMALGALLDVGASKDRVLEAIASVLEGVSLEVDRVGVSGIRALSVKVLPEEDHAHRTWKTIRDMLRTAHFPEEARRRSLRTFERLAIAESKIHGVAVEDVTFHEVGAVDSIADIVGVATCFSLLGVKRVFASAPVLGFGTVSASHGPIPIPAPATMELLLGVPCQAGTEPGERVTPTGAAILAEYVESYGPMPRICLARVGYGAGTRRWKSVPNVLRVVLGATEGLSESSQTEEMLLLEANIDDMDPRILGALWAPLFEAGAVDVWHCPVVMKKGRLGCLLSVLCAKPSETRLLELILRETTTLGVRIFHHERRVLQRDMAEVETRWGRVRVKVARDGGKVLNVQPELDDCLGIARGHGVPLKQVLKEADAAAAGLWERPLND